MKSIPDNEYNDRIVTLQELTSDTYKTRVHNENRNHDYRKFAVNRKECNVVIKQNIEKSHLVTNFKSNDFLPDAGLILNNQLDMLCEHNKFYVLCTCVFFIPEYNTQLLM